jgi:hypothetical protein
VPSINPGAILFTIEVEVYLLFVVRAREEREKICQRMKRSELIVGQSDDSPTYRSVPMTVNG